MRRCLTIDSFGKFASRFRECLQTALQLISSCLSLWTERRKSNRCNYNRCISIDGWLNNFICVDDSSRGHANEGKWNNEELHDDLKNEKIVEPLLCKKHCFHKSSQIGLNKHWNSCFLVVQFESKTWMEYKKHSILNFVWKTWPV